VLLVNDQAVQSVVKPCRVGSGRQQYYLGGWIMPKVEERRASEGMSLNDIAEKQWAWVERMGWHNKQPLEYVALIASEIGEVANEFRGEAPTAALGEELADVVLRCLDMARQFDIDMEHEVKSKMQINEACGTRGRFK